MTKRLLTICHFTDYIQGKILETYRASGFERISTPMLEDLENLDKSDGGDNLNLIFKVLKRGEKLQKALAAGQEKELSLSLIHIFPAVSLPATPGSEPALIDVNRSGPS